MDKGTASRRVNKAVELGYLIDLQVKAGQKAKIILGDPLPEDTAVLPRPEEL